MRRETFRVYSRSGGVSKVKQSESEGTDINVIMRKWQKQGIVPTGSAKTPQYGDFSDMTTYHLGLTQMIEAQADFEALPSAVRKHCDNDPGKFLDLVFDPERQVELVDLGLLPKSIPKEAVTPTPAAPGEGTTPPVPAEPAVEA